MISKLKPKSEFFRNVLTLMTGTTIAQAIPVAISPVLTRIYTPEAFGIFGLFVAISSIFGVTVNFRYEFAILLPQKEEEAINLFALGFIINCTISFILLILVVLFNDYFVRLLNSDKIGIWLYFIPIPVFFIGIFNLLNYFNIRKKNYKDLKNAIILKSIILAIIQLSVGFIKQGATGLVTGQIISNLFANMKLLKNILKDGQFINKIKKVKILSVAKKYKDFPLHNLPGAISDTFASQLTLIMMPKLFGLVTSGYFFLAQRIVSLPAGIIAGSISQVFFQTISYKKRNNEKAMPFLIKTLKTLFVISLFISIILILIAPYAFTLIFGDNWKISGIIVQYLAAVFFITFIVSPVSSAFSVSGYIKRGAKWKHLYLISSSFFFAVCSFVKLDLFLFLKCFVLYQYLLYLLYLYLIIKSIKQMDEGIKKICAE